MSTAERPLTVVYRAVADLKPDPRNARAHPKRQVEQIAASIARFGFSNPILIDGEKSLIAGHGRLLAAKKLGMSEVPTIELAGLSEAQRRALRLADNRIALESKWDFDMLKVELGELAALDLDLTITGFSTGELDRLMCGVADAANAPPPSPVEPRTRRGDIWTLGDHRIGCGDGRDRAFLARLIGAGEAVDAAFLDPPLAACSAAAARQADRRSARDAAGRRAALGFLNKALGAAAKASRAAAVHFVCADWRHMGEVSEAGRSVYGEPLDLCVWTGRDGGAGPLYRSGHALVFVYRVDKAPRPGADEADRRTPTRRNVWDHRATTADPTAMPVALIADAIRHVTRPGRTVLASFLGSGSALIAAERCGRRLRGADADPARIDAAVGRWAAETGGKPVLERAEAAA